GLKHLGAIAPGYRADLLVVDNFVELNIRKVYKDGKLVAEDGCPLFESIDVDHSSVLSTINMDTVDASLFKLEKPSTGSAVRARIIGLVPGQLITRRLDEEPAVDGKIIVSDTHRDILKLAVVERHKKTGNIGLALVHGFGLKTGALASSVGHDSHNIIVVGVSDSDMAAAVNAVAEAGGGLAAVKDGRVLELLELPIAGLMTDSSLDDTVASLRLLHQAATTGLGCTIDDPFTALSFLSLPVIPELKLTDKGLVDVDKFDFVDLFL
ncbi:MAG: adenine deaminase C-terminal domain-containing protein, partial [Gammaproteobacteria bacterium]|nr:adenine deaminase C-terminal domain-containing protein [Gammaproteobacteria bacterium]